jgi:hypothetical protein
VATGWSTGSSESGGGDSLLESDVELDGCWGLLASATLLMVRCEVESVDDGERKQSPALR